MRELVIPPNDYSKLKFYLGLQKETKLQILDALNRAPLGLQLKSLVDFVSGEVGDVSKEDISNICKVYLNLLRVKEVADSSGGDFMEMLSSALKQTEEKDLIPTKEVLDEFAELLSITGNSTITSKIIDLMTENTNIFGEVKIYQDVRPSFDDDKIIGSAIIHSMKIIFQGDREMKEIYLSLDDNDLDKLIEIAKAAQNKSKIIKAHFNDANIIEIK